MSYTLAEAAAACGVNKSTVLRAVKGGRISGTRDDLGVWHVEAVECTGYFHPLRLPRRAPRQCRIMHPQIRLPTHWLPSSGR
jgi:hypothetical protein